MEGCVTGTGKMMDWFIDLFIFLSRCYFYFPGSIPVVFKVGGSMRTDEEFYLKMDFGIYAKSMWRRSHNVTGVTCSPPWWMPAGATRSSSSPSLTSSPGWVCFFFLFPKKIIINNSRLDMQD